MKVILISSVSGLGKIGDVVEVKNGYGRNFLIPNKKAICFTEANNKTFEEKRKHFEQENQKIIDLANEVKKAVIGKNIIIVENASDDGRLYGSVTSAIIADKINNLAKNEAIVRSHIFLQNQIKEIGIFSAKVSLHPDAEFNVQIIVCRNESEVDDIINSAKEAKKAEKIKSQEEENLIKSAQDQYEKDNIVNSTVEDLQEQESSQDQK